LIPPHTGGQVVGQTTSQYGSAAPQARTASPTAVPAQWSQPGCLKKASFKMDGRPVYTLLNNHLQVLCYVIPQPGLSLDQHVHRTVGWKGAGETRGDGRVGASSLTGPHGEPLR